MNALWRGVTRRDRRSDGIPRRSPVQHLDHDRQLVGALLPVVAPHPVEREQILDERGVVALRKPLTDQVVGEDRAALGKRAGKRGIALPPRPDRRDVDPEQFRRPRKGRQFTPGGARPEIADRSLPRVRGTGRAVRPVVFRFVGFGHPIPPLVFRIAPPTTRSQSDPSGPYLPCPAAAINASGVTLFTCCVTIIARDEKRKGPRFSKHLPVKAYHFCLSCSVTLFRICHLLRDKYRKEFKKTNAMRKI